MLATRILSELSTETCIVRDLSFVAMPPRGMLVAFAIFMFRGTVMGQVLEDGDPAPARCALDDDVCLGQGHLNHTDDFYPEDPPLYGPHALARCCQPDPHQGHCPEVPPRTRTSASSTSSSASSTSSATPRTPRNLGREARRYLLRTTSKVPEHPHPKTKSRAWTRRRLLREQWKRSWRWSGRTWATYGAQDKKSRWKCW